MNEINKLSSAKVGDKLIWTTGDWRNIGEIIEVKHRKAVFEVDMQSRHTVKGARKEQAVDSYSDEMNIQYLTHEFLLSPERNLLIRRTADIRMTVRATTEGREFTVWGKGDGISDANGMGGGLKYTSAESL